MPGDSKSRPADNAIPRRHGLIFNRRLSSKNREFALIVCLILTVIGAIHFV
jgi:hypothetical protein